MKISLDKTRRVKYDTYTMKMILSVLIGAILAVSASADTFQISGSGNTSIGGGTHSSFGTSLTYGLSLASNAEATLTQGISYSDAGGTAIGGSTKVGGLFFLGSFAKIIKPFVGVEGGALYGNNQLNWSVSPVVGARVYVKSDVYVYGKAGYDFNLTGRTFTGGDTASYSVGVGWSF